MRTDNISLEENRFSDVDALDEYPSFHERHRLFPAVLEGKKTSRILDVAAGMGVVGKRIQERFPGSIVCNDVSPKCLKVMGNAGLETVSFDIDSENTPFPFDDQQFDVVIALATIEHVINIDHFVSEIHRVLKKDGYFFISAPNYNGALYLLPVLLKGVTFHDPFNARDKYEFYAHVRYFTYRTLVEYIQSFRFSPEAVYVGVPKESSRFLELKKKSWVRAKVASLGLRLLYTFFSPRWASEPVVCFKKMDDLADTETGSFKKIKKLVM